MVELPVEVIGVNVVLSDDGDTSVEVIGTTVVEFLSSVVVDCSVVVEGIIEEVDSVKEVVPSDDGATSVEVVGTAEDVEGLSVDVEWIVEVEVPTDVEVIGKLHSGTLKDQSHHFFSGLKTNPLGQFCYKNKNSQNHLNYNIKSKLNRALELP